jgi:hypothetical protein
MPLSVDIRIDGKQVAGLQIVNDGTGDQMLGNYDVFLYDRSSRLLDTVPRASGRVGGFDRARGAVALVGEACLVVADGFVGG